MAFQQLEDSIRNILKRLGVLENPAAAIIPPPFQNLIINGNFRINQRAYVSGASLASGVYGFDRWKSTTAATALTFTAAPNGQPVTMNTGKGIQQIIERENVAAGTYVLSWVGTSTARVYNAGATPPAYAFSPIEVTLDGLTNVAVEFTATGATKTISKVQLEPGAIAHTFSDQTYGADLMNCQRYYYRITAAGTNARLSNAGFQINTTRAEVTVSLPVPMRVSPSMVASNCYWTDGVAFNQGLSSLTPYYGTLVTNAASVFIWVALSAAAGANYRPGILSGAAAGSYIELTAEL
jgi:hypothetical protein